MCIPSVYEAIDAVHPSEKYFTRECWTSLSFMMHRALNTPEIRIMIFDHLLEDIDATKDIRLHALTVALTCNSFSEDALPYM
jgi:hypothetical protein